MFGLKVDKKSFKAGAQAIQGLKRLAMTLAAEAGIKSIATMVEHAGEAGTHIIALSKQFGISTKAVQEWSYVAKQSGSNITELGVGISQFERNLRVFSTGKGSKLANDSLKQFGFTATEAAKLLDDPEGLNKALFQVSAHLSKMTPAMRGATDITALFGRRAKGIAGDLAQGPEALRAQIARLHELGGVIPDEQLQNLKKFNNDLNDLKTSFHALIMQVVGSLAPALSQMLRSASAWVVENKELISTVLLGAVKALAAAFSALGAVIDFIGTTVEKALGGDDGAWAILIGIAAFIGAILIPALWGMAAPVIVATLPFLAIAALVALIAFGIIKLVKSFPAIKQGLVDAAHWALAKWQEFIAFVKSIPNLIEDAFKAGAQYIKDKMNEALEWIRNKAHEVWADIKGFFVGGEGLIPSFRKKAAAAKTADTQTLADNPNAGFFERARGMGFGNSAASAPNTKGNISTTTNITVGPTNVTINAKDGKDAREQFDAGQIDRMNRAAAAATGGEIR